MWPIRIYFYQVAVPLLNVLPVISCYLVFMIHVLTVNMIIQYLKLMDIGYYPRGRHRSDTDGPGDPDMAML
jgi:hypothetical protein